MKKYLLLTCIFIFFLSISNGCNPVKQLAATPIIPTAISETSTSMTAPVGKNIVVTNADDSGPGTLRQAMQVAQPGDIIIFDPEVFPPDAPKVSYLQSSLPSLSQGFVTLDASDAGVILDGSKFPDGWDSAFMISSNNNSIRGFQITNFSGPAVQISNGQNNRITENVIGNCDYGIGLWGINVTSNKITGNYLGVSVDGITPQGNKQSGIVIQEAAQNNQIGPDNHIAFNSLYGIEIHDANTIGNTIFQNSIHDNGTKGISLTSGGNNNITVPILFDFDLVAGSMDGQTCPNCEVLVYSDTKDEGLIFEGQTVSDDLGIFTYQKGSTFIGPHLTTTATDTNGNTSEFSTATTGAKQSLALQMNNFSIRRQIQTQQVTTLSNNRIGDMFPLDIISCQSPGEQNWSITHVENLGLKWVRLSLDRFDWSQVQTMKLYSKNTVNPCQDQIISWFAKNNVTILYTINFWDENLTVEENYPRYHTNEEIQNYLEYTRFIVNHFKGRIQYYEILNEPVNGDPQGNVEIADYINLIHRVVPIIREEDPKAKIVIGGATNLMYDYSRDYLFGVIQSNVMPLVDGIALHPMYGASPQYEDTKKYYYAYPELIQEVREISAAHGFFGEIFAEEMVWRTPLNPNPFEPWEYTPNVAAKYYARGIVMTLGLGLWAGISGERYDTIQPIVNVVKTLSTTMAGATPSEIQFEVQSDTEKIISYGFSLDDGSKLFAVWIDGVAVDEDPGSPSLLSLTGFSDWTATGIDVLNGYEQKLNVSNENGDLVIQDFLIKDYPIIIRLSE